VHINVILLSLHIVYIGVLVAVTAYLFFSLGKKKGISFYIREEEKNIKISD